MILQILYDFTDQENVEIWCGIRDSNRKYMVTPDEPSILINGRGELQWNFQLRAPLQAGEWKLEAYLFHVDDNDQEQIDNTRIFSMTVLPFYEPDIEITTIQSEPPDLKLIQGKEASLMISIRYSNFSSEYTWPLRAVLRDGITGEDLGEVITDPLPPGDGEYAFPDIVFTPKRTGEWPLQLGIQNKDCPTGVCGIQEFLTKKQFTIMVIQGNGATTPVPTSTAFDFSITLDPNKKTLKAGGHSSFYINIELQDGESKEVTLYLNDLPTDWNYFFDPKKGKPDFKSELIIYLPTNIEEGTYGLIITAKGENIKKQKKVELKVEDDETINTATTEYLTSLTIPRDNARADTEWDQSTIFYIIVLILVIIIISGLVFFNRKKQKSDTTTD